jgi:hypothetical protein
LKGAAVKTWEPVSPGISSLTETVDGYVLRVDSLEFVASHDTRALGVLCFAYGLDNELFDGVDPHSDVGRWLVWHFCALLSRREEDPDLPVALQQALVEADSLTPDDSTRAGVRNRLKARLLAIERHYGCRLTTLQAIEHATAGMDRPDPDASSDH